MKTRVSSTGHIVLPAMLRRRDRIEPGQLFAIERVGSAQYLLRRLPDVAETGLVDWLLDCPDKGWFEPIRGESTDSL